MKKLFSWALFMGLVLSSVNAHAALSCKGDALDECIAELATLRDKGLSSDPKIYLDDQEFAKYRALLAKIPRKSLIGQVTRAQRIAIANNKKIKQRNAYLAADPTQNQANEDLNPAQRLVACRAVAYSSYSMSIWQAQDQWNDDMETEYKARTSDHHDRTRNATARRVLGVRNTGIRTARQDYHRDLVSCASDYRTQVAAIRAAAREPAHVAASQTY